MFCFLRDVEPEDPTFQMDPFAIHHQHMNHVLSGSFGYSPFLSVTDGNMPATRPINSRMQTGAGSPFRMLGMSVGFMNMFEMMSDMIGNMEPMAAGGNCQTFSVSAVISYSNTGDGVLKVYQGTSEMCSAPSGIRENQRTVQYSGSGLSRLGQAPILQCSQNHCTGAKENSRTTSTWMKVRQQRLMMNGKGRHPDLDRTSSEISTA